MSKKYSNRIKGKQENKDIRNICIEGLAILKMSLGRNVGENVFWVTWPFFSIYNVETYDGNDIALYDYLSTFNIHLIGNA